ncbi:YfhO family protein [Paludibaculum fermentans]|uniref:YfhO family protein n=1 Tax=Paludibaculum fermentans TaxID=1473598 RepID=UPI003EB71D9B
MTPDTGDSYRIRYTAASPTLIRFAIPYYPGWAASVSGQPVPVVPVDLALTGIHLPPGNNEVTVVYHSTWFRLGSFISGLSSLLTAAILAWALFRIRSRPPILKARESASS